MQKSIFPWILFYCGILLTDVKGASIESISFNQAHDLIFSQNAGIKAFQADIDAAQEGVKQAGVIPNPSGSLALEKFGANEMEAIISQTVELGGKRRTRTDAAKMELEAVRNNLKGAGIELEAEIIRRFIPIAIISKKLTLLDSMIMAAEATKEQIRRKVDAGATRKTDFIRAEIALEQLAIERSEIVRKISQARNRFAALGGKNDSVLLTVSGSLDLTVQVPDLDTLRSAIKASPGFASFEMHLALLEAEKRRLKAESAPNLELSAGYIRKMPESVDAPLVGFAMDIPVFNRNEAAMKKLSFQREALGKRRENDLRVLDADVKDLYGRLTEINRKMNSLKTVTIPKARSVYITLSEYYNAGSTGFLDLSAAQSELLEFHMDLLELEAEWANVLTDLMQLTSCAIKIVK